MGIDSPRRAGSDRPQDGRDRLDRPHETGNIWSPRGTDIWRVPTKEQIEHDRLVARGELQWRNDRWEKCEPHDYVKFQDRIDAMKKVQLPEAVRELPKARDRIPVDRWNWTEVDARKFFAYGMDLDHPQGRGKALGYEAIGYKIRGETDRWTSAWDMVDVSKRILPDGHVVAVANTPYGMKFHAVNGIIGPNGRHATYDSCWMIDERGDGLKSARMITSWVRPHKEAREEGDQDDRA